MRRSTLGDRLLVADAAGQLGWSPVYLRYHVAQLDTYDYLRFNMADGHEVCSPSICAEVDNLRCATADGHHVCRL